MRFFPTYVWRPVPGIRHAFPVTPAGLAATEQATTLCGKKIRTPELHAATDLDWIHQPTCTACWEELAARTP